MERRYASMEIRAHMVSAGKAEGNAVVYDGPFSFMGDLDPNTGKVPAPRHKLEGTSLANKVFVFTTGKGSSGGDSIAWMAKQKGNAPSAIICMESEPVLSGAVIAAKIPTVDQPEVNILKLIQTGDYIKVDATRGVIEIVGR
jgi:predicted aconitase with swiveling domain